MNYQIQMATARPWLDDGPADELGAVTFVAPDRVVAMSDAMTPASSD